MFELITFSGASAPVADCVPLSMLKRLAEAQPPPAMSSKNPVGRRGRLANLTATIESWEDDLSFANIPSEKPGMGFVPRPAARTNSVTPDCKAVSSSKQVCWRTFPAWTETGVMEVLPKG